MPKPPRPSASEVLRHNLLILVGLPSLKLLFRGLVCKGHRYVTINLTGHTKPQVKLIYLLSLSGLRTIKYNPNYEQSACKVFLEQNYRRDV